MSADDVGPLLVTCGVGRAVEGVDGKTPEPGVRLGGGSCSCTGVTRASPVPDSVVRRGTREVSRAAGLPFWNLLPMAAWNGSRPSSLAVVDCGTVSLTRGIEKKSSLIVVKLSGTREGKWKWKWKTTFFSLSARKELCKFVLR